MKNGRQRRGKVSVGRDGKEEWKTKEKKGDSRQSRKGRMEDERDGVERDRDEEWKKKERRR
jgi:hypothetical protein